MPARQNEKEDGLPGETAHFGLDDIHAQSHLSIGFLQEQWWPRWVPWPVSSLSMTISWLGGTLIRIRKDKVNFLHSFAWFLLRLLFKVRTF